MNPPFKPTHRHAEGGLYQLMMHVRMRFGPDDHWEPGVCYRDDSGMHYCRTRIDFDTRFTLLGDQHGRKTSSSSPRA